MEVPPQKEASTSSRPPQQPPPPAARPAATATQQPQPDLQQPPPTGQPATPTRPLQPETAHNHAAGGSTLRAGAIHAGAVPEGPVQAVAGGLIGPLERPGLELQQQQQQQQRQQQACSSDSGGDSETGSSRTAQPQAGGRDREHKAGLPAGDESGGERGVGGGEVMGDQAQGGKGAAAAAAPAASSAEGGRDLGAQIAALRQAVANVTRMVAAQTVHSGGLPTLRQCYSSSAGATPGAAQCMQCRKALPAQVPGSAGQGAYLLPHQGQRRCADCEARYYLM